MRRKIGNFVQSAFEKHLFVTNMALGSGFMLCGDVLAQKIFQTKSDQHDWGRTKNMYIMGTGFGVLGHFWYKFLDRKFPGKSWPMIRSKLLCECAATPAFAGYTFLAFGALQGERLKESFSKMKSNFHLICLADWCVYVPVQFLNFYFLPPRYRFLCVCAMSVGYDFFLAWLLNKHPSIDGTTPK